MSEIHGFVENIIYQNPVNGYTVLNVESNHAKVTVVGTFSAIEAGIEISAEGEFVEDSRYGRQFRAVSWRELEAQGAPAMQRYLASGAIKGVGAALAERIVSKFGADTFRIMEEEPERLAEIRGISENKARQIALSFEEKSHTRRVMMQLAEYGISGGLALRLYEKYGEDIFFVIKNDPYSLTEDMEGIGFKIADDIAKRAGVAQDSPSRIRAGLIYVLSRARSDGHVCLPASELMNRASELLEAEAAVSDGLADLIMNRRVVQKRYGAVSYIYPAELYRKESECAMLLHDIDEAIDSESVSVEDEIARSEVLSGITLDPVQRDGVAEAIRNGVLVITGGPGTGKTTLIRVLLSYYGSRGMLVTLAAPTGRAAKRLSEATGVPATTIHRMLEVNGGIEDEDRTFIQFDRNAENPLETNVVIIDEMSMVDTYLFHALLSAIAPGTRLIMVGDDKQLPSVGPGAVLKDIIDSGVIKVITLRHVFRQAEKSDIVKNAHAMLEGRDIHIDNKNSGDFYFLEMEDEDRIIEGIIYLVQKKLSGYLGINPYEIQVMAPMKKGALGIVNLNERLRAALNPVNSSGEELKGSSGSFRVGDKVMQIKNNYELNWLMDRPDSALRESGKGVFNGDMGTVTDIYDSETLKVLFDDGRAAVYSRERLSELELSFAITIHKSQGSEYPAVVVPILSGPDVLMTRNILYTAITRAKRCVVLIGSKKTVMSMIRNDREQLRYTGLRFALERSYRIEEN